MASAVRVAREILRGVALRCPRCGKGRVFQSFFDLRDACAVCGLPFEPGHGEWSGAMMFGWGLIFTAGLMGYFVIHVFTAAPLWVEVAWLGFWALAFPVLFYRNLKGGWLGVLYATDALAEPGGAGARGGGAPGSDVPRGP